MADSDSGELVIDEGMREGVNGEVEVEVKVVVNPVPTQEKRKLPDGPEFRIPRKRKKVATSPSPVPGAQSHIPPPLTREPLQVREFLSRKLQLLRQKAATGGQPSSVTQERNYSVFLKFVQSVGGTEKELLRQFQKRKEMAEKAGTEAGGIGAATQRPRSDSSSRESGYGSGDQVIPAQMVEVVMATERDVDADVEIIKVVPGRQQQQEASARPRVPRVFQRRSSL